MGSPRCGAPGILPTDRRPWPCRQRLTGSCCVGWCRPRSCPPGRPRPSIRGWRRWCCRLPMPWRRPPSPSRPPARRPPRRLRTVTTQHGGRRSRRSARRRRRRAMPLPATPRLLHAAPIRSPVVGHRPGGGHLGDTGRPPVVGAPASTRRRIVGAGDIGAPRSATTGAVRADAAGAVRAAAPAAVRGAVAGAVRAATTGAVRSLAGAVLAPAALRNATTGGVRSPPPYATPPPAAFVPRRPIRDQRPPRRPIRDHCRTRPAALSGITAVRPAPPAYGPQQPYAAPATYWYPPPAPAGRSRRRPWVIGAVVLVLVLVAAAVAIPRPSGPPHQGGTGPACRVTTRSPPRRT